MIILGLTGSIGMGKSVAANTFRHFGIPVHDADLAVHDLMKPGGAAFDAIVAYYPPALDNNKINRKILGDFVFQNDDNLEGLENILHPMVRQKKNQFLGQAARRRCRSVVLDVPLLFETGGHKSCDGVVVVHAPDFVQRARVMRRPGMTAQKFTAIREKQMTSQEKCRRADFVVQTGIGRLESLRAIRNIIDQTKGWRGAYWPSVSRQVSR
jgi:dephospho-CoA kinase